MAARPGGGGGGVMQLNSGHRAGSGLLGFLWGPKVGAVAHRACRVWVRLGVEAGVFPLGRGVTSPRWGPMVAGMALAVVQVGALWVGGGREGGNGDVSTPTQPQRPRSYGLSPPCLARQGSASLGMGGVWGWGGGFHITHPLPPGPTHSLRPPSVIGPNVSVGLWPINQKFPLVPLAPGSRSQIFLSTRLAPPKTQHHRGGEGGRSGRCFNFHFGRWGAPSLLDPLPPSPLILILIHLLCAHIGQHSCHKHGLCCDMRIFCFSQPQQICPVLHVRPPKGTPNKPQKERVVAQPPTSTTPIIVREAVKFCGFTRQCQKGGKCFHRVISTNTHKRVASHMQKKVRCVWTCSKVLYVPWVMPRHWKL